MKLIKDILLTTTAVAIVMAACSISKDAETVAIHGQVIASTDSTLSVLSTSGETVTIPKREISNLSNSIFVQDTVVLHVRNRGPKLIVDDIILVAHQWLSNVDELFVGEWGTHEAFGLTFNFDKTTDNAGERWSIRGKKMMLCTEDMAQEFDIVRVDANNLTLANDENTYHLRRVR